MIQTKSFQLKLKNDQVIELKFTSIEQTNNELWQMFATTDSLNGLQQLIDSVNPEHTKSAKKVAPKNKSK